MPSSSALCALACVAAQIAYPLTHGSTRDAVTAAVVLLGAAAALAHAAATRGPAFAAGFAGITALGGLATEILGTATGFPFGCYSYAAGRLGPELAGVPLVVPLAWTSGLYPVFVVATLVRRHRAARIAATAVGMAGWDLYLDPQMVADGQWRWCSPTPAPPGLAIPVTNYLGWLAVAAIMAAAVLALARRHPAVGDARVPVGLFCWTWLGSALAHAVFLGEPELRWSAIYGLVGMGILGVPLLLRTRPRRRCRTGMAR